MQWEFMRQAPRVSIEALTGRGVNSLNSFNSGHRAMNSSPKTLETCLNAANRIIPFLEAIPQRYQEGTSG